MKLKLEIIDVESNVTNAKLAVVKAKLWRALTVAILKNPEEPARDVVRYLRAEWGRQFTRPGGAVQDPALGGLVQDAVVEVLSELDNLLRKKI